MSTKKIELEKNLISVDETLVFLYDLEDKVSQGALSINEAFFDLNKMKTNTVQPYFVYLKTAELRLRSGDELGFIREIKHCEDISRKNLAEDLFEHKILQAIFRAFKGDESSANAELVEIDKKSSKGDNSYASLLSISLQHGNENFAKLAAKLIVRNLSSGITNSSHWVSLCIYADLFSEGLSLVNEQLKNKSHIWQNHATAAYFNANLGNLKIAQEQLDTAKKMDGFKEDAFTKSIEDKLQNPEPPPVSENKGSILAAVEISPGTNISIDVLLIQIEDSYEVAIASPRTTIGSSIEKPEILKMTTFTSESQARAHFALVIDQLRIPMGQKH